MEPCSTLVDFRKTEQLCKPSTVSRQGFDKQMNIEYWSSENMTEFLP